MELLVFGHAGARVLVFPTRDGRFYDYENWRMVKALSGKIDAGLLQLYCVDSNDRDSLYADWMQPGDRMKRHLDYEAYILNEVLPFSLGKNDNPFAISHGCSLGAYHAVNLAFKHPQHFGKVVALSGRYDLTLSVGSFRSLFDGYYDDLIYFNNPSHYLPRLEDEEVLAKLRKMDITIAIGQEDAFLQNNREFSEALWQKGIWHRLTIWDGEAHRSRYWRRMIDLYL
jgi:esterase/lipase superfamily enzyme